VIFRVWSVLLTLFKLTRYRNVMALFEAVNPFRSSSCGAETSVVKLVAEYLQDAFKCSRMAAEATHPKLKESFEKQAAAYRNLADKRAAELNLPPVNLPVPRTDGGPP
jgi:hypothetical protein